MATYEVTVQSQGGGYAHAVRVEATSQDNARAAARDIANAEAKARGQQVSFVAVNVRQIS